MKERFKRFLNFCRVNRVYIHLFSFLLVLDLIFSAFFDWRIVLCIFSFLGFLIYNKVRYSNPYKLIMVFGKKGSGKTTLLTKLALKYIKRGIPVYSTTPVPGAYLFDPHEIGMSDFPPDSVIFVDEVGLVWNSRDFKTFSGDVRKYFKYQRHLRHTVYLFSQAFDIDKNLRDLTDYMYIVRCYMNFISIASMVGKRIAVVSASQSGVDSKGESRICDDYYVTTPLMALAGSRIFTYIPAYSKYYDSFEPVMFGKSPALTYIPPLPRKEKLRVRVKNRFYAKKRKEDFDEE